MASPVSQVFLSYGREDGHEFATRLVADLRSRGPWHVWMDQTDIGLGRSWDAQIERAVRESDVLAAVLTRRSVDEYSVCRDEVVCAFEAGKRLITLRIVDDPDLKPVLLLRRRQWIDFTKSYHDGLEALVLYLTGNDSQVQRPVLEIVEDIRPLDFAPEIARSVAGFVGRNWLREEVERWLERPQQRALAIVGPPGSGKSAIAAWLANGRKDVVAAYFCSSSNSRSLNPWYFVASLVSQLRAGLDGFREAVDLRYPHMRHESASDAFRELIVEPAVSMTAPERPQIIIVDALDEAVIWRGGKPAGESIVDVLAQQTNDLPPWLRVAATSQPLPDVLLKIGGFDVIRLEQRAEQNYQDTRQYLARRLANVPAGTPLREDVARLAEGNFLVLKHTVDGLEDGTIAPEEVEQLAPGLATAYLTSFQRRFPADEYRDHMAPLLGSLVAACAPLSLSLLAAACGETEDTVHARLRSLEPYLRVSGSGDTAAYSLFHPSLRHWLTDRTAAGGHYINPRTGNGALADAAWTEFRKGAKRMSPYAEAYLASHLLESERWEELLELTQCAELGLLSRWIDKGEGDVGLACLTGIVRHLGNSRSRFEAGVGLTTQIARLHMRRGAYEEAEQILATVLRRTSWMRGRRARAVAVHELGSLHLYRSQYCEAARCYRRALRLCRMSFAPYHDEAAANLVGLAVVEQENCRFRAAQRYAQHAIAEAIRAHDAAHHVAALRVQALARRGMGEYDAADAALGMAMAMSIASGVAAERPRLLLIQGWLEYDRATLAGQGVENSTGTFHRALDEAVQLANRFCIMEAKLSLAWCALAEGNADLGEEWLKQLRVLLPPGRHLGLWAGHTVAAAAVLHVRLRLEEARDAYRKALPVCRENRSISWGIRARVGLGATLWYLGETDQAQEAWSDGLKMASEASASIERVARQAITLSRRNAAHGPR